MTAGADLAAPPGRPRPRPTAVAVAAAIAAAAALVTAVVALTGPAGGDQGGEEGGPVRTVVLEARHSRFSVGQIEVRRGETVRFVVRNLDPIAHELIVGDMAVQNRHEVGTESHHGDRPGELSVPPGATAETLYRFGTAGRLYFGCHLPGHWAYGMQGLVIVR